MRRGKLLIAVLAVLVAGGATWLALGASGQPPTRAAAPAATPAVPVAQAPAATTQPPLPKARPRIVQPVAGEATDAAAGADVPVEEDTGHDAKPARAASGSHARSSSQLVAGKDPVRDATALRNGVALPPLEAPDEVMQIIEAGNVIARSPYKWGGGHGKWKDTGYDCSGSVSYALAAAGLLGGPLASGPLMKWGRPGRGKWVTIFANPGHVYMEVAGLRFDTSGTKVTGSRWQNDLRPGSGFVARHPPGL